MMAAGGVARPAWVLGMVCVVGMGCGGGKASSSGESSAAKLGVRVARVDMKDPGFNKAVVDVVVTVENGSTRDVQIKGAKIEAQYEGMAESPTFAGAMEPKHAASVGAGGTAYVPVEIDMTYPEEVEAFMAFSKKEIAKLRVRGTVDTNAGPVALDDVTEFPTPRLLQGQIKEAQMASMDQGEAGEVTLELVLNNPNPFPVRSNVWDLKLSVAGKELKSTQLAQSETIQPNAGVGYSEVFKVDQEHWGPDYKTVLKLKKVPYEANGTITVGGITYPFQASGSMNFHR